MTTRTHPLERLHQRLRHLGHVLAILCCAWIGVVGQAMLSELSPNALENHRSPAVKERLAGCEGEFTQRFACTDAILLAGERNGATAIFSRMGLTLMLPSIAWLMWRRVMDKAETLVHHH